jgi:hypothetical protein
MDDNLALKLYKGVFAADDYPDGDFGSQTSKSAYKKKGNVLFPDFSRKGYDMKTVNKLLKTGINKNMYKDRNLTVIDDDAIDDEGNWGFCFYKTGKKVIANFNKAISKYTGKAREFMDNIRLLNMSSVYDHEKYGEEKDQGYTPHGKMSAKEILGTKNPIRRKAKLALVKLGAEQKTKQALEIMEQPGIKEEIESYKNDKIYNIIKKGTARLHGIPEIPDREYKLASGWGD